jgi:hypothetical protein
MLYVDVGASDWKSRTSLSFILVRTRENTTRPHSALGYRAPAAYADHLAATGHRTALAIALHYMKAPRAGRLLTPRRKAISPPRL